MKIIHLTDPHFVAGGNLFDLDPEARLAAAILDVNTNHADAEFAVISGDLADRGDAASYERLKRVVSAFRIPVALMLGNHDRRDEFRSVFYDLPVDSGGFVQQIIDVDNCRFVLLDTLGPGDPGVLCDDRLDWLDNRLREAAGKSVYIFMHHPPFDTGHAAMDLHKLADPDRFKAVVLPHKNVRHIFFGHVHRPISGSWNGISLSCLPSLNHQVTMDLRRNQPLGAHDGDPSYGVVLIGPDSIMVHNHDYLTKHHCFILDDPWVEQLTAPSSAA